MQIPIHKIIINDRMRKDAGSLDSLVRSIEKYGLLQPLIVDQNMRLISGFRRLSALKRLGYETAEVQIIEVTEKSNALRLEIEENVQRKAFTEKELLAAYQKVQNQEKRSILGGKKAEKLFYILVYSFSIMKAIYSNLISPTIKRLPSYLIIIEDALRAGEQFISGTQIAKELDLDPIQVRKDITQTKAVGIPRRGFKVKDLVKSINEYLNWSDKKNAVIIGAGNLGSALMGYQVFRHHQLHIVAAFDTDRKKTTKKVHGISVFHSKTLCRFVTTHTVNLAILTVPSNQAQQVTNMITQCGIRVIWNFTNIRIRVQDPVIVWKEDLSSGYAMLSVMMKYQNSSQS